MKFKQSFITIKPKTVSQPNRPGIYTQQVLSQRGENQNSRNLNNVFRIRGPHSSNSDPLKFLKKKHNNHNNIQKTTSVSSEEQKLKEEIEKLKTKQDKLEAQMDEQIKESKDYRERSQEALQRGDKQGMNYYSFMLQNLAKIIQEHGKMMDRIFANRRELEKKLQKLQVQKI